MSKRRIRSCPRCGVNFSVTMAGVVELGKPIPVAGQCEGCGYEMAWRVFTGKPGTRTRAVRAFALITVFFVAATTLARCNASDAPEEFTVYGAG